MQNIKSGSVNSKLEHRTLPPVAAVLRRPVEGVAREDQTIIGISAVGVYRRERRGAQRERVKVGVAAAIHIDLENPAVAALRRGAIKRVARQSQTSKRVFTIPIGGQV